MNNLKKSIKMLLAISFALFIAILVPSNASAETETLDWETSLFKRFGFSANGYFEEGEEVNAYTVYEFTKMTSDMSEYLNEETWYYELTLEQYMEIVDKYFQVYNEDDVKDILNSLGHLDGENVSIYSGGSGGGLDWVVTYSYVDDQTNYYHIQGLYLTSGSSTSDVQYDEEYYIECPVELVISSDDSSDYEIISYTKKDYYIEDTEDMGMTLTMFDQNEGVTGTYYAVYLHDANGVEMVLDDGYMFTEELYWYSTDKDLKWSTNCYDGFTCQVEVTRIFEGEISISYAAEKGVVYGGGEVELRAISMPLFTVDADHATITVIQGLTDMGDGTYAYETGAAIELIIEAETGYEVESVVINYEDGACYSTGRANSFGTWEIYPDEFWPGVIEVTTVKAGEGTSSDEGTGEIISSETVTITSGNSSAVKATVEVAAKDAEQFDGLTFVVEELEKKAEEAATTLITNKVDADDVYILDLHFENADGEEVKVNATMTVTVPIPEGWDPATTAVYYVNPETGEVTNMNGVVSEDRKTITFTTTHFSYYALVQETVKTADTNTVKTGDNNNVVLWMVVLLAAGVSAFVTATKKSRIR